jgi:hypothetical protein
MINPVMVDKINDVEKGRRERQVAEIQLINKAYPQQHGIPNPLKIARMLISRLGLDWRRSRDTKRQAAR